MDEYESQCHTWWDCKYCVALIPKCRRRTLYEELKKSWVEEKHLMPDHVGMMVAIPPKCAVSEVIGYIKGKSAIHLARVYGER